MATKKLRDLFVVRKGGGKTTLTPGKRYVITKAGTLRELGNEDTETFDQYAEDPNTLLMLGDRGDLRQLETIQRNISILFNSMVPLTDLYNVTATVLSPQIARSTVYDCGGLAFCAEARIKSSGNDTTLAFDVFGSTDQQTWELIDSKVADHVYSGSFKAVALRSDRPKYRYFKLEQTSVGADNVSGVVFLLKQKAVSKFFAKRDSGQLEALVATDYDQSSYVAGQPAEGSTIHRLVVPQTLSIKPNFDGFQLSAGTNPTTAYSVDVQHNGASIGTLQLSNTGSFTASGIGKTTLEPGDVLRLVSGPAHGAAGMSVTLSFERDPV